MIITVTLNPCIDKTCYIDCLKVNSLNRVNNIQTKLAGKGINVARTLEKLSIPVKMTGFISENYTNLTDFIFIDHEIRVNLKIIDQKYNLTEINEPGPFISQQKVNELKLKLKQLINPDDIVIISGSVPKSVETGIYYDLICLIREKKAKSILDADDEYLKIGIKANPNFIKPNKYELCKLLNLPLTTDDMLLIKEAYKLLNCQMEQIVLSSGKNGAYFINKHKIYHAKSKIIDYASTVGAGDALVAGIALSLEKKYNQIEMIKTAMATALMHIDDNSSPFKKYLNEITINEIV